MKKITFILVTLALCANFCYAQQNVFPLPLDNKTTIKGSTFRYALPITAIKMTVTVAEVQEFKGYYADYAQSLLGLSNIITENKTYFALKDISVAAVEVPDFSNTYLVVMSAQQIKDNMPAKLTECRPDYPDVLFTNSYNSKTATPPDFFRDYSDLTYTQTEDAFVETKIIDGVVTQIPSNRTKTVSKTNSQKAQEAADAISKSRKDQYNLISGEHETPYTAETIETMLRELKKWENNYLSLFTGIKLENEKTYTFYVVPDSKQPTPAFAFSAQEGLSLENLTTSANIYSVGIQPLFPAPINGTTELPIADGYRYRNPEPAQVALWHGTDKMFDFGILNILQLGDIQTLPSKQDQIDIKKIGFVF